MLDPWIIEEIRRREEQEREQRPHIEIPADRPPYPEHGGRPQPPPDSDRGVIIVDLSS